MARRSGLLAMGFCCAAVWRAGAAPVMVVEPLEQDAGQVLRGSTARFVFTVRNTGDEVLRLDARPACGCTRVTAMRTLQPGKSGPVTAEMATDAFHGPTVKLIDVVSNDPRTPALALRTRVDVLAPVEVLPSEYPVARIVSGQAGSLELTLHFRAGVAGELKTVLCANPYARVKSERLAAAPDGGARYALHIDLAAALPAGRTALPIVIATTSRAVPELTVYAACEKGILATPRALYLGEVRTSAAIPAMQAISLHKAIGTFRLTGASTGDPHLTTQVETAVPGTDYRITVRYRGGWPAGSVNRTLRVRTDDPGQPLLTIPITATVQGRAR